MTREDQVLALFGDANPVPDAEALVAVIDTPLEAPDSWSGEMTKTIDRQIEVDKRAIRRKPWMGAAAAAVVLIVAVAGVAIWRSDEADVADTPEVEVVQDYYAAFSSGDVARMDELRTAAFDRDENLEQVLINLGNDFALSECENAGPAQAGGTLVQCTVLQIADWDGPAGIEFEYTLTATVTPDLEMAAVEDNADRTDGFDFNRRFWSWLRDAHPDVYEQIGPVDAESLPGYRGDPADALVALQYVDEFVAQSDIYPLGGGS